MKKLLSEDKDIQQFIGNLLRVGVLSASAIALIGGILYLSIHGLETRPDYHQFHNEPVAYTHLTGILNGVLSGNAGSIMQLGVVVLILTPIMRVACSLFSFAVEKDKMYVIITSIVLCIILFSMFCGIKI